jgi:hypothetical protein
MKPAYLIPLDSKIIFKNFTYYLRDSIEFVKENGMKTVIKAEEGSFFLVSDFDFFIISGDFELTIDI